MGFERYVCWLGENIIAEGDTLDELRDNLEWQVDGDILDAIDCYDSEKQEDVDVYELLGIYEEWERMLEEYRDEIERIIKIGE
ncbi:MAG: hypothetical protein F7B59_08350 [Desulfurococcales archaeon]|nr:hypothetical protein [Desulfurococcales archaeon]